MKIDSEAKGKIELTADYDKYDQKYYHGKLQWPGTLEFSQGASFMVFLSEEGCEEIQIAPLDLTKRQHSNRDGAGFRNGRMTIELHPVEDGNQNIYYIGEALGPVTMNLIEGIYVTVFTSKSGEEEIQISKLRHKTYNKRRDVKVYQSPRKWPAKLEDAVS